MAKTRHNRTACRILIRVGLSIYMAAVVLSAVIVLAYGIYRLFVRPPEVAQPGAASSSQHGGESQSTPLPSASGSELPEGGKSEITDDPQQLQRKELFYTFLLVGTDMLLSFDRWYRYEELIGMVTLAVFYRGDKEEKTRILQKKEELRVFVSYATLSLGLEGCLKRSMNETATTRA